MVFDIRYWYHVTTTNTNVTVFEDHLVKNKILFYSSFLGGGFPPKTIFHIHRPIYWSPLSATPPKLSIGLSWNLAGLFLGVWICALAILFGGFLTFWGKFPLTYFWFLHFDLGVWNIWFIIGMFYISNWKQLNFHSVSYDNVGWAFVSNSLTHS